MLVGILDLIMSESAWTSVITKKFSREDQQRAKSTAKRRRKKLTEATESLTVGLSDQQLVTGIAIMITGYTRHCSMKSRHWWIVFDLAFFSAVTHLASLPALQRNMAKNPRLRDLRVFLMLSNYIMLLVSAILSFRDYDEKTKYCPIRCTFDRVRTKRLSISPVYTVQMILLTIAFIWQLVKLYSKQETLDRRHELITRPRIKKSETTEELDRRSRLEAQPSGESNGDGVAKIQEPQQKHSWYYGICRWIFVILISPPAPLVWAVILTMWAVGLSRLLWDRQWAIGEENQWSFGQVLPLLLVVLPFFSVLQVLEGKLNCQIVCPQLIDMR